MKTKLMALVGAMALASLALPLRADSLGDAQQPDRDRDVARSNMMPRLGNLQRVDHIIGAQIQDNQGQKLGKVKDLALDMSNGRIAEVIVETGSAFGDRKIVAIPPVSFAWDSSMKGLCLSVNRDTLKVVPEFSLAHWDQSTEISQIREVYQRYGAEPYFKDDQMLPAQKHEAYEQGGQDTRYYAFDGNNALPRLGYISRASKLTGTTVWNMENEKLARVEDFMVDLPAGRAVEVVLGAGGFFHANDELTAVPPQCFHWNADKTALTLDTTKEALKTAPHFKSDEYAIASSPDRVRDVYERYHILPYFSPMTPDTGAQNVRERRDDNLNTLQNMNSSDLKITDQIHQELTSRENLSLEAKNVKIVTVDGTVTLVGSVASDEEKRQMGELAAKVVPANKVDNQLQVRSAQPQTMPAIPPLYNQQ